MVDLLESTQVKMAATANLSKHKMLRISQFYSYCAHIWRGCSWESFTSDTQMIPRSPKLSLKILALTVEVNPVCLLAK